MTAEKKKVAVVVDTSHDAATTGNAPFNFHQFAAQLYAHSDEYAQQQMQRSGHHRQRGEGVAADVAHDGLFELTSEYQVRRTSIVDGVTAQQLALAHRKSLADLSGHAAFDPSSLAGVTLSKRHMTSRTEYDAGRQPGQFEVLESFQSFDADAAQ